MTRSDILSYPLIMLVAAGLLIWTVFSSFRETLPMAVNTYEQVGGVLLLVAGLTLSAILDAFVRHRASRSTKKLTQVNAFNPTLIHEIVHLHLSVPTKGRTDVHQWELTSAGLVGQDNSLALAKLRIDLEQALRELVLVRSLDATRARSTAIKMAELLAEHEVLSMELVEPIRQIMSVCNQAIHGYEVSDGLAESVVSVGDELLGRLRWLIEMYEHDVRKATAADE